MDLRQIRYFLVLATELNFTRAASRLHISQPPLTRQIQQLEASMGVVLFERTTRGVALTEAGAVFYEEARKIVALTDQATQKTRLAHTGQLGRLDIGIFGSAILNVIPTLLIELRKTHPDVVISLQNTTKIQQIEAVREKRLDIGFNRVYPEVPDLAVETVMMESLYVATPRDHPLTRRRVLAVRDLVNQPLILFPNNVRPTFADNVVALCRDEGFTPLVAHEVEDVMTCIALVAAGLGLAVVPESAVNLQLPGVRYHLLRSPNAKVDLSCVYRADNSSPALAVFLEMVRKLRSGKLKLVSE
ncbi:LysR family transcriptional regulator [Janthinobacterium sp. BJB412]|nr:LysR family transcriptional regulator [Janthinobacterium sp. BJB412]